MILYIYIYVIYIYIYTYIIILFRGTCRLVRAFPPPPSSVASWARGVVVASEATLEAATDVVRGRVVF